MVACDRFRNATLQAKTSVSQKTISYDEMKPGKAPPPHAKITQVGLEIPVDVVSDKHDKQISLRFLRHGQVYDSEAYIDTPEHFQLVRAADEVFDPPIDLLRFPLAVGFPMNWQGRILFGNEPIEATAKITPSFASTTLAGNIVDVVKVKVVLNLDSKENHQQMTFIFVPGEGLQKSEFGLSGATSREPILLQ